MHARIGHGIVGDQGQRVTRSVHTRVHFVRRVQKRPRRCVVHHGRFSIDGMFAGGRRTGSPRCVVVAHAQTRMQVDVPRHARGARTHVEISPHRVRHAHVHGTHGWGGHLRHRMARFVVHTHDGTRRIGVQRQALLGGILRQYVDIFAAIRLHIQRIVAVAQNVHRRQRNSTRRIQVHVESHAGRGGIGNHRNKGIRPPRTTFSQLNAVVLNGQVSSDIHIAHNVERMFQQQVAIDVVVAIDVYILQ